jgi:hypothetical protein
LRRVGVKLSQLLDLVFDGLVLLRSGQCLRSHGCILLSIACLRWLLVDAHAPPAPVKFGKSRQIFAIEMPDPRTWGQVRSRDYWYLPDLMRYDF